MANYKKHNAKIDELITANLTDDWRFERVPDVLKAILRAGLTELKHGEAAKGAVISEYVKIADAFVDADEVGFVNAMLEKVSS